MTEFKYRPDVDGLRAVAVVLVLLFHAGLGFTGGYIGVDVFFVLSGFLITGLILKQQDAGQFSLADFWLRRIRRIIPAATAVVIATMIAGAFLLLPQDYTLLSRSAFAQQLMLSNVFFLRSTGYFAGPAETHALLHTWSLAVEEQFYLFYPFLLILLHRFSRRLCLTILVIIGGLSLMASQFGISAYPEAGFYLLPTRAWELLIGGLIWYIPAPSKIMPWLLNVLSWLALAAITASGWFYSHITPFPGLAALVPCGATALFIYCNTERLTGAGKLLATKPVVFIGLISYSLYLWHWPILAFTRYWMGNELSPQVGLAALALGFVLAVLSWKYIETPFRHNFKATRPLKVVAVAVVSTVVLLGVSRAITVLQGMPQRLPEHVRSVAMPIEKPNQRPATPLDQLRSGVARPIGAEPVQGQPPDFLLWGDSHAHALEHGFDTLAKEMGLSGTIETRSATIPLLGVTRPFGGKDPALGPQWNRAVVDYVQKSGVQNVIIASRWAVNIQGRSNGSLDSLIANENENAVSRASAREAMEAGLTQTLEQLQDMGVRVWIIKQIPLQKVPPQRLLVRSMLLKQEHPKGVDIQTHQKRQSNANAIIDRVAARFPTVRVIDPSLPFFDGQEYSIIGSEEGSFYFDEDHISMLGTMTLLRGTLSELLEAVQTPAETQE